MIKRNLIIPILIFSSLLTVNGQVKKQDTGLKREVTLYNPYKPTLPDSKKRSFLPDLNDTSKVRPSFRYDVKTTPFLPEYTISPIKAAALLPDPLPKLYKSYINLWTVSNNRTSIGSNFRPDISTFLSNRSSDLRSLHFSLGVGNDTSVICLIN